MNQKTNEQVKSGKSDYNIDFKDFQTLLAQLGFVLIRQKGSHLIYFHYGIHEMMNIQKDGAKAKAYEVRQLRKLIMQYDL